MIHGINTNRCTWYFRCTWYLHWFFSFKLKNKRLIPLNNHENVDFTADQKRLNQLFLIVIVVGLIFIVSSALSIFNIVLPFVLRLSSLVCLFCQSLILFYRDIGFKTDRKNPLLMINSFILTILNLIRHLEYQWVRRAVTTKPLW